VTQGVAPEFKSLYHKTKVFSKINVCILIFPLYSWKILNFANPVVVEYFSKLEILLCYTVSLLAV
jgi:hypothetical protein